MSTINSTRSTAAELEIMYMNGFYDVPTVLASDCISGNSNH